MFERTYENYISFESSRPIFFIFALKIRQKSEKSELHYLFGFWAVLVGPLFRKIQTSSDHQNFREKTFNICLLKSCDRYFCLSLYGECVKLQNRRYFRCFFYNFVNFFISSRHFAPITPEHRTYGYHWIAKDLNFSFLSKVWPKSDQSPTKDRKLQDIACFVASERLLRCLKNTAHMGIVE